MSRREMLGFFAKEVPSSNSDSGGRRFRKLLLRCQIEDTCIEAFLHTALGGGLSSALWQNFGPFAAGHISLLEYILNIFCGALKVWLPM